MLSICKGVYKVGQSFYTSTLIYTVDMGLKNHEHRQIVVKKETYETLRNAGTITDSFDAVISRLIVAAKLKESKKI
jgi:hypothetical protein